MSKQIKKKTRSLPRRKAGAGTLSFREKVFEVVKKIPKGKTLTYKEVANRAGSPKAYRAVGSALKTNYDPKIPCHRVIKSDGTLGEYNRGRDQKAEVLKNEQN